MAELDTEARDRLQDRSFAYIDKRGERHLPINDETHVRNAVSRFSQTEFESAAAKRAAASKIIAAARRYGVDIEDDDIVARAARG